MSTELEAKLEQAIRDKNTQVDCMDIEIADIRQQIAAEAKELPIRTGDEFRYGGLMYYAVETKLGVFDFKNSDGSDYGSECTLDNYKENSYVRTGFNFFDDLKAMQESVTEFEVDLDWNTTLIVCKESEWGSRIEIEQSGRKLFIPYEHLGKVILKLRQMEATLKRQQAKE